MSPLQPLRGGGDEYNILSIYWSPIGTSICVTHCKIQRNYAHNYAQTTGVPIASKIMTMGQMIFFLPCGADIGHWGLGSGVDTSGIHPNPPESDLDRIAPNPESPSQRVLQMVIVPSYLRRYLRRYITTRLRPLCRRKQTIQNRFCIAQGQHLLSK